MLEKRILLVDDEENILDTYSNLLSEKGFSVVTSTSVRKALKEFFMHPFDLVITDLGMTEGSGFTLIEEIKEKSPHTPVMVFTGKRTKIVSRYASLLGACTLIEKACSNDAFVSCVMRSLG
jgi:DNA-binding NtrC family response regulator